MPSSPLVPRSSQSRNDLEVDSVVIICNRSHNVFFSERDATRWQRLRFAFTARAATPTERESTLFGY